MSAAPRARQQAEHIMGPATAQPPAPVEAPVLSLVRPRRAHSRHPGPPHTVAPPRPGADRLDGNAPASPTAVSAVSPKPASAGPAAHGAGAADAASHEDATAPGGPLTAGDRALLTSMAPALATALVEVLVGARAAPTVERWVEASLYERIVEHTRIRGALAQGNPHADRPLGVSAARICEVSGSVVEISLVVRTTRRPRALALRLVRRRSRWRLNEFLSI